ncbi:uncharacterized protein LOC6557403 [Drosophila grimshawi]|uniref:uncharacterized protein LOC6557403 n=1 Tax=Drosophila grimshawi TaxID=7222 RepID=UPI001C93453F|nr:uncharacterized protein LOC6557403 [Drosophila grimshawi]
MYPPNSMFLLCAVVVLTHISYVNARALVSTSAVQVRTSVIGNHTARRSNDTALTRLPAQAKSLEISQPTGRTPVAHIIRKKRETEMTLPFDFNTMHLPCDLDQSGRAQIVSSFPNHCIWVWNNKYAHEGTFRVYKTYQLEAFFFGQYYERLKRFEIDPHTWDYGDTGV